VPLERSLDDSSLDPLAAAVNEPDRRYPGRRRGFDVLGNDRGDVGREKVVKINLALNWNPNRGHKSSAWKLPSEEVRLQSGGQIGWIASHESAIQSAI
jgi:hypothetical protein